MVEHEHRSEFGIRGCRRRTRPRMTSRYSNDSLFPGIAPFWLTTTRHFQLSDRGSIARSDIVRFFIGPGSAALCFVRLLIYVGILLCHLLRYDMPSLASSLPAHPPHSALACPGMDTLAQLITPQHFASARARACCDVISDNSPARP